MTNRLQGIPNAAEFPAGKTLLRTGQRDFSKEIMIMGNVFLICFIFSCALLFFVNCARGTSRKEVDPETDPKPGVHILQISSTLISSIMYLPAICRLSVSSEGHVLPGSNLEIQID